MAIEVGADTIKIDSKYTATAQPNLSMRNPTSLGRKLT
jgi:hypothetical protein